MNLLEIFLRTQNIEYVHEGRRFKVGYHIEVMGDTLLIDFKWTDSIWKWFLNFMFWKRPYRDMKVRWRVHSGFLRSWRIVKPHVAKAIENEEIKKVRVVGYSHGGALAMLCHEFVGFHRPDVVLEGFAFGAPKVLSRFSNRTVIEERWRTFQVLNVRRDIVGKVPPFFFRHVGTLTRLEGNVRGRFDSHSHRVYRDALREMFEEEENAG